MGIKSIILSRLRNAENFQFHTEFKALVEILGAEALKIAVFFAKYLLLYAKVDAAYKKINKSPLTEQIREADKARDEAWRGMEDTNTGALRHFDPAVRTAATQLKIVFKTYQGSQPISITHCCIASYAKSRFGDGEKIVKIRIARGVEHRGKYKKLFVRFQKAFGHFSGYFVYFFFQPLLFFRAVCLAVLFVQLHLRFFYI